MTLDEQWADIKPKILAMLEEGWSRGYVFKQFKVYEHSKIYDLCFMQDHAFRESILKYRKKYVGIFCQYNKAE